MRSKIPIVRISYSKVFMKSCRWQMIKSIVTVELAHASLQQLIRIFPQLCSLQQVEFGREGSTYTMQMDQRPK